MEQERTGRFRVELRMLPVGVVLVAVFRTVESLMDMSGFREGGLMNTLFPGVTSCAKEFGLC